MTKIARLLLAALLILAGLYLALFGNSWGPPIFGHLEVTEIGIWVTLIVPFLPMAVIGLGATLWASRRRATWNAAGHSPDAL